MSTYSVLDSFKFAWNAFKTRPGILIGGPALLLVVTYGIFFIVTLVSGVAGFTIGLSVASASNPLAGILVGGGFFYLIIMVVSLIVGTLAAMGLISFFLKAYDNLAGVGLKDLVRTHPFWRMLGASILVGIVTQIGLMLFVLPGIIAVIFLAFTAYFILDKDRGVFSAIGESFRLAKENFVSVLLLLLAVIAANVVGAVLLLVGLLVSIPVSMLAMVHGYRHLSAKAMPVPPMA